MSSLKILRFIRGTASKYVSFPFNQPSKYYHKTFLRVPNVAPLGVVENHHSYNVSRCSINLEFKRFKKIKGRRNAKEQDEEDESQTVGEEDEDDDISNENPMLMDDPTEAANDGAQVLTINVNSLRLDSFSKTAFSLTRAKIEEAFYKGNIYINGEKALKKALDLSVQDEIDIVKGVDPQDHSKVQVRRVVIVSLPDKTDEQGRVKVQIKRWLDLTVEAHPVD